MPETATCTTCLWRAQEGLCTLGKDAATCRWYVPDDGDALPFSEKVEEDAGD